eukprot:PITA_14551
MINWTHHKGKIGGFTNATHLALLPKENRPSSFSRFRPISLCNSSYKIMTKILASRLKPFLPSLISENQGGFLANRKISDSILLVQEAIHSSQSRKEKGFILKLDLANAFDRVRHSFLLVVLQKIGFVVPFLDLIKACISDPWISPLINGRPGPSFQSSRGLRQGCSLSPYLFILIVESFSKALDYNWRVGLITARGGNEKKKYNLINLKQFIQTQERGGLGITSPKLLNLAFGDKIVWRFISNQSAWWKSVLETKYLNSPRQHLLDYDIPNRVCSKIWKLCKKAIPFLAQNISKVPNGGTNIKIGADKIMGQQPISSKPGIDQILSFFDSIGFHYLDQISQWDTHSQTWTRWNFPAIPIDLEASFANLQAHLHSIAPIKKNNNDGFHWDPSGSNYTIKAAHQHICNNEYPMPIWSHWKIAWKSETIPKIKFFIWVLLKGKVLTSNNWQKQGIIGPSRCQNCQAAEETIQHLFIACPFSTTYWK